MHDSNWIHAVYILSGSTAMAFLGHAVNSFPTPENIYGQWFLGCLKFLVGQRMSALNAVNGNDTATIVVPRGTAKTITPVLQEQVDKTNE